jgi:hypothetical protein
LRKYTIVNLALASIALSSMVLPLWALSFNAPVVGHVWKTIIVYGTGSVQGSLDEVNKANQYVGLQQIRPVDVLALKLIPLTYILAAIFIVLGGWRLSLEKTTLVYVILLLSIPLGIQYWLYAFGHNINPDAPIALDPFTPYVVGSYEVANFMIVAYLHVGYFLLVGTFAASYFVNKKRALRH